jgi:hypothetical protein
LLVGWDEWELTIHHLRRPDGIADEEQHWRRAHRLIVDHGQRCAQNAFVFCRRI